jgi:hypothetical protein
MRTHLWNWNDCGKEINERPGAQVGMAQRASLDRIISEVLAIVKYLFSKRCQMTSGNVKYGTKRCAQDLIGHAVALSVLMNHYECTTLELVMRYLDVAQAQLLLDEMNGVPEIHKARQALVTAEKAVAKAHHAQAKAQAVEQSARSEDVMLRAPG